MTKIYSAQMQKTIEQRAIKFIDENLLIKKRDKILIALSGGADSIFLLYFLKKFARRFGIKLAAFHLNHQLRGKIADEDEKFCSNFCKKNGIEFISVKKDVRAIAKKMKVSVEEAGREVRYLELNKAAKKIGCNKIATAHNSSDNVETVLLNLFKGTGLKGLSGIPVRRENIIRPIICLSSEEIRKYLKADKIPYRIDESNLVSDYERNYLRNEIIPKLKQKLNPSLEDKINNTSKIISEINAFIEKQIEQFAKKAIKYREGDVHINLKIISSIDKSLIGVFLKSVLEKYFDSETSSENLFDIENLMKSQTGSSVHLKENVIAWKERNELVFKKSISKKTEKSFSKLRVGEKIKFGNKLISINKVDRKSIKFTNNKSIEFISGDRLKDVFVIRRWKAGDKFHPIGMKGTKKISDFLSNEKISSSKKKEQLVLTNDGKIVWVIGLRIDEEFKVTDRTKKIYKLSLLEL